MQWCQTMSLEFWVKIFQDHFWSLRVLLHAVAVWHGHWYCGSSRQQALGPKFDAWHCGSGACWNVSMDAQSKFIHRHSWYLNYHMDKKQDSTPLCEKSNKKPTKMKDTKRLAICSPCHPFLLFLPAAPPVGSAKTSGWTPMISALWLALRWTWEFLCV